MKAIKTQANNTAAVVTDAPIPKLRDGYVLVKTKSVALNPTDWKHIEKGLGGVGATLGCDLAGEVVEVGSGITKDLKKGDRILCFTHGGNNLQHEDGCFGEYAVCKGDLATKIPEGMSFEDAATLPVAVITCGQNMYQGMKLPWPGQGSGNGAPLLVYGASSSTGMAAVQLAKLSGFEVLATCSPHNADMVRSLGADEVYDYKDPDCAAKIRKDTDNKLFVAFDCISVASSMAICLDALSSQSKSASGEPPKYGMILNLKDLPRKDVEATFTLGYTIVGEPIDKGSRPHEPHPEDFEFGKKWSSFSERLLADGKLKPLQKEIRAGGLDKVLEGCNDVKTGKNSGVKLVYPVV